MGIFSRVSDTLQPIGTDHIMGLVSGSCGEGVAKLTPGGWKQWIPQELLGWVLTVAVGQKLLWVSFQSGLCIAQLRTWTWVLPEELAEREEKRWWGEGGRESEHPEDRPVFYRLRMEVACWYFRYIPFVWRASLGPSLRISQLSYFNFWLFKSLILWK